MSNGNTVVLNLGGKERRVRYDLNAIAEIGDRLDIKVRLDNLGADLLGRELPLRALRTILWAGLIHEDENLTEQEVGKWVGQDNMGEVLEGFFGLFGGIGAEEKEKPAKPKATKAKVEEGTPST